MPKRIIIAVTNDLSMDQRVHRVASTLVDEGWNVLAVGRELPGSTPLKDRPYKTHRLKLRVLRGKWFYFWFNFRLFFYLIGQAPEVVYANDMDTLPAAWLAARLRGAKLVYDSHELWSEIPELVRRPRTRAIWLWLEKRLFPRVDVAITVNQPIADIYRKTYHKDVHAVRNLPLRLNIQKVDRKPGRLIWYQGALNEGRGLELMMEAMKHLSKEYHLGIAGEGPIKEELQALVHELGLDNRVTLYGHISFKELPSFTQKAALGLSLEESYSRSYQLATPNKLFDYIQSGIPVVVSGLPEMKAIVAQHGVGEILEESERTGSLLARRIMGIVEEEARWIKYRQCCLDAAEKLCWEEEAGLLKDALKPIS